MTLSVTRISSLSPQFLLDKRAEKAAVAELREALAAFPKNPELHQLLGLALYAPGRNVEAIDSLVRPSTSRPTKRVTMPGSKLGYQMQGTESQ